MGAYSGQIGLQLNRTPGPLDISRATARESVSGYSSPWSLTSYAICAAREDGIHADGRVVEPGGAASDRCDLFTNGYRTHGAGGGGGGDGITDGGPAWLRKIESHSDLGGVDVELTGPLPNGVVAHQTCAFGF